MCVVCGCSGSDAGPAKDLQLKFTVNNLFNHAYISSIGTNGFVFNDPAGTAQTLLPGAPRTAFLTLSGRF